MASLSLIAWGVSNFSNRWRIATRFGVVVSGANFPNVARSGSRGQGWAWGRDSVGVEERGEVGFWRPCRPLAGFSPLPRAAKLPRAGVFWSVGPWGMSAGLCPQNTNLPAMCQAKGQTFYPLFIFHDPAGHSPALRRLRVLAGRAVATRLRVWRWALIRAFHARLPSGRAAGTVEGAEPEATTRRGTQKGEPIRKIGVLEFAGSNIRNGKGQDASISIGEIGFIGGIVAFIELVNVIFMQYLC